MRGKALRLVPSLVCAFAFVVSADIAPDAAKMLLAGGRGDKNVRIENEFSSCVKGNTFAVVRHGKPESTEEYDVVETLEFTVYVPKSMSFEDDVPKIVTFPRSSGYRSVGVSNTKR